MTHCHVCEVSIRGWDPASPMEPICDPCWKKAVLQAIIDPGVPWHPCLVCGAETKRWYADGQYAHADCVGTQHK